ncbi:hypothetical protein TVNIR_2874 [Thioalkalivibrio nitratireducens DSM 14787]|uniref:Uncharacterized protein n=1 Tax=Thioalkalivibrio nitratireducens (strain DSM 14787 / UNIQEM 213 / ALEN2) TaxID=1255043 RepID=L0E1L1_THIND|nr:hypothetical protein TVNIR_2874 [Thioalkalivibrio nitratireducens DSM 14787]
MSARGSGGRPRHRTREGAAVRGHPGWPAGSFAGRQQRTPASHRDAMAGAAGGAQASFT